MSDNQTELKFHYNRDERLKMSPQLEEYQNREKKKGFFRGNKALMILVIDVLIVLLIYVLYAIFLKPNTQVGDIGPVNAKVKSFQFENDILTTVTLTLDPEAEGLNYPVQVSGKISLSENDKNLSFLSDELEIMWDKSSDHQQFMRFRVKGTGKEENIYVQLEHGSEQILLNTMIKKE